MGHKNGTMVRVGSPRGSVVVPIEADAGIPRGSAAMAFNTPGDGAADLIEAIVAVNHVRVDSLPPGAGRGDSN
ncbi:MAG: molybdopterin dinucleotide binding domain-containing protein [Acidimicrobiales bacterium]